MPAQGNKNSQKLSRQITQSYAFRRWSTRKKHVRKTVYSRRPPFQIHNKSTKCYHMGPWTIKCGLRGMFEHVTREREWKILQPFIQSDSTSLLHQVPGNNREFWGGKWPWDMITFMCCTHFMCKDKGHILTTFKKETIYVLFL